MACLEEFNQITRKSSCCAYRLIAIIEYRMQICWGSSVWESSAQWVELRRKGTVFLCTYGSVSEKHTSAGCDCSCSLQSIKVLQAWEQRKWSPDILSAGKWKWGNGIQLSLLSFSVFSLVYKFQMLSTQVSESGLFGPKRLLQWPDSVIYIGIKKGWLTRMKSLWGLSMQVVMFWFLYSKVTMSKQMASGTARMIDSTQMEMISMAVRRGMPTPCTLLHDATALYLEHTGTHDAQPLTFSSHSQQSQW